MSRFVRNVRGTVAAALVALSTLGVSGATAQAASYKSCCEYKVVVTYETRLVAYAKCFTLYDHCGRPYRVTKTFHRAVQVPVKNLVLVCD